MKKIDDKKTYKKRLKKYQLRLLRLQQILFQENIGVIFVMEGMDAAGKGGAIKRVTERLDPRGFRVQPISAPAPHEKRYHYLQRFWRKLPKYGQITIFDRSWYGRVLVERIEKFATEEEWQRAYQEINQFEKMCTDDRYIIAKFWFQIDQEEQLKRFKERENNPLKNWKITDEDWRNREKWDQYQAAAEEMFAKTDVPSSPWFIIEGNDKRYARVRTLEIMVKYIEQYLNEKGIKIPKSDEA
ncbi:polyphosphate kinase 2 family protein [Oikeobacillus pervagus]|nr:UDP-galactose-lipid carrier transferase [Oikeobacillus pervagus]